MASLVKRLGALGNDDALRLVAQVRPQLLAKVAELRAAHLKGGPLAQKTKDGYRRDARRVSAAGGDPRVVSGTAASFRKLRAACIWQAREDLRECLVRADRERKMRANELFALCIYDAELPAIEQRIAALSQLNFEPAHAERREKTHQQRSKLGRLPADWIDRVHLRTKDGKYGAAVAVSALIPVRPAEIAEQVQVLLDGDVLVFKVKGAKVSDRGVGVAAHVEGIGQPSRTLRLSAVDPSRSQAFVWLSNQVRRNGGSLVVGKGLSAGGIGSAFRSMSAREFPRLRSPPSIYALRHEACAELKASGIGAQAVAKGMGHTSESSQSAYGMRSQGSGCYEIETAAPRAVRSRKKKTGPPVRSLVLQRVPSRAPKGP